MTIAWLVASVITLCYLYFDLVNFRKIPIWFCAIGLLVSGLVSVNLTWGLIFALLNLALGILFIKLNMVVGLGDTLEISTLALAFPFLNIGGIFLVSFTAYWLVAIAIGLVCKYTIYRGQKGMPFTLAILFCLALTPFAVG